MRRSLILAALALALVASGAQAAEPRANLADIEDEVMCPICGTPLELSEAPQAERQRVFIRELIAEGQTKEQIKAALVAEYGEEVLAIPDDEGFDLAAWVVPAGGIAIAAIGIALGLRRWRRSTTQGSRTTQDPLDPADEERLRSDLGRYGL